MTHGIQVGERTRSAPAQDVLWYSSPAARVVEFAVLSFALWTVAYHLVLLTRWPSYLVPMLAVALAIPALVVWIRHWPRGTAGQEDRRGMAVRCAWLCTVGVLAASYVLVMNRPDSDGEYLRRPLVQMENLRQPVITENVTYDQHVPDVLWTQYVCSYEMLAAFAGRLLGLDAIQIYFDAFPAMVAFLAVLVYALLYRSFALTPWAVAGATVGAVLFLVLDGNRHGAPGNFALVRLWQGKCVLATLAMPCAMLWGFQFLRRPSWRDATFFFLLGICGVGLSATGIFLIPAAALVLATAFVALGGPATGQGLLARCRWGGLLGLTTAYPVAVALLLHVSPTIHAQVQSVIPVQFPAIASRNDLWLLSLWGVGSGLTLVWYGLLLGVAPWLGLGRPQAMLVVGASAACVLLFFNPITGPTAQRLFGAVFFRLFYLFPLGFCFGLLGAAVLSWRTSKWKVAMAALLMCLFGVQSERFTFSAANGTARRTPGEYRFAQPIREFERIARPGLAHRRVLAPSPIALAAAVTSPTARFMILCPAYTNWSFVVAGNAAEGQRRSAAQTVVTTGAKADDALQAFRDVLTEGVDAVVTGPQADARTIDALLAESGGRWACAAAASGYRLLLREDRPSVAEPRLAGPGVAEGPSRRNGPH